MLRVRQAGLQTPLYGPLGGMCEWASFMSLSPDFDKIAPLVIFNHHQQAELITLEVAKSLNPEQFAMSYVAPYSSVPGAIVKYIQIGTIRAWLYCCSANGWKAHSDTYQSHLIPCNKPLPGFANASFPEAIFSIDFIVTHHGAIAIGFDPAPNLTDLGLERYFSSETICQSIINHLDTAPVELKEGAW